MNNRQRAEIVYDAVLKSVILNQNQKQSIEHQGKGTVEETSQKPGTGGMYFGDVWYIMDMS
jgi:hypothetical protein